MQLSKKNSNYTQNYGLKFKINMMKILFLADSLGNGGAERQFSLLVRHIPDEYTRMVCSFEGGPFYNEIQQASIPIVILKRKWKYDIFPMFKLWLLIAEYKPDIVHTWGWIMTLSVLPISIINKFRFVNGIIRTGSPNYQRKIRRHFLKNFGDFVVSNSKAGLINWEVNPSKGKVVYNGLDPDRLEYILNNPIEKNNEFTVIMAARLVKEKDFLTLLKAAKRITEKGFDKVKFWIVGNGLEKNNIIENINRMGLNQFVQVIDGGQNALQYMLQAHVGVLLTNDNFAIEGCSNTIMEYMACKLPVICTNSGGNSELISDDKEGFFIPPFDDEALVEKLLWLYNNPEQSKSYGQKAFDKFNKNFRVEQMIEGYQNLYKALLPISGNY